MILDLEQVMPKSVGINTFTITNGEISMTCMASGKEAVADFVIELKKIPYVSDVRVENITDTYDEFSQVTSTFNLSFNISVINDEEAEGAVKNEINFKRQKTIVIIGYRSGAPPAILFCYSAINGKKRKNNIRNYRTAESEKLSDRFEAE